MIRRPPRSPLFPYTPLSRSMPSSTAGRTSSRRYFGLLNGCTCRPSHTSPATRHMVGFTPMCRVAGRSEEHTSELQSRLHLVCRLLLEKKKKQHENHLHPSLA